MVWVINWYPHPSTNKKNPKIPPLPRGAGSMNFQKLKNNQNSKETIKLTQIHGTWYAYSIGTPTPLQTKKIQKSHPFLGRRSISAQTTFRAWERPARRPHFVYTFHKALRSRKYSRISAQTTFRAWERPSCPAQIG